MCDQCAPVATNRNQSAPSGTKRIEKVIEEISAEAHSVSLQLRDQQALVKELVSRRRQVIAELRALELSQRRVGEIVGITGQRVYQLDHSPTPTDPCS